MRGRGELGAGRVPVAERARRRSHRSGQLSPEEFGKAMHECTLPLSADDINKLFRYFDKVREREREEGERENGPLSVFLETLPPLTRSRAASTRTATAASATRSSSTACAAT